MCTCANGCSNCGGITLPAGAAGADGLNAFTETTADFVVPSVSSNVVINVSTSGQYSGLWGAVGQPIYIEDAGMYEVVSVTSATMTVKNLGTSGNASPAATISFPVKVSPSGKSVTGATGANGDDGVVIIDSDPTVSTAATTSAWTNKMTVAINGTTLDIADVGDCIELDCMIIGDTYSPTVATDPISSSRYDVLVQFGGVDVIQSVTSSVDQLACSMYADTRSSGNALRLNIKLIVSDTNALVPVIEAHRVYGGLNTTTDDAFTVPNTSNYGQVEHKYKKPEITGFTLSGSNNLTLSLGSSDNSSSVYLVYYEVRRILKA